MNQAPDDGRERYDVLRYSDGDHEVVPAGDGELVREAHERKARRRRSKATLTVGIVLPVIAVIFGTVFFDALLSSLGVGLVLGVVGAVIRFKTWHHEPYVPALVAADVPPRVVEQHVDEFDPAAVTSVTDDDEPAQ